MIPQFGGAAIRKLLRDYEFQTVIDIGCGAGEHTKIFRQSGKTVTAIDIGKSLYAKRATEKIMEADFLDSTMSGFDCAWCCHVLEHQENVGVFLRKVAACVDEGGVIAITVPPMKHEIVGGHVSLWNAGLLIYRLVLTGLDCSKIAIKQDGYNITGILRKKTVELPSLSFDCGDIRALRRFFPTTLSWKPNHWDDPFDGDIKELNWQ